jgi:steroid 5-alpha reductase family enzyme
MQEMNRKIDKVLEVQSVIQQDIAAIKVDLAHHIKRSDKHEKQIDKLWYLIFAIFAGGGAKFGPEILKHLIGG